MPLVAPVITATLPSSRPMPVSKPTFDVADIPQPLPATQARARLTAGEVRLWPEGHNCAFSVAAALFWVACSRELERPMAKWIDDFREGWRGDSQPSLSLAAAFAVLCLVLATAARFGLAQIRPDVFFTPYFPAVFFATAFGGYRVGIATALASGLLGVIINFSSATVDPARFALLMIFWVVCGIAIWGVEHYRSLVAQQREVCLRRQRHHQQSWLH